MPSMPWDEPVPIRTGVTGTEHRLPLGGGGHLPELLAPAGSWEALVAAIKAGADAVYLGGKQFGARQLAENFDDTKIADAIELAHRRDVSVYVTVNTLIAEKERQDAVHFLLFLHEVGADAVLIQDVGLAFLARKIVPGLALHASTQLTIHNRAGVLWAAEQGFNRVVLSRELSLAAIREIGTDPALSSIGLEIFIHGALCYAYSGQCLLSSAIGGRSGNRGWCAQPCRKPYQLVSYQADDYDRPVAVTARDEAQYHLSMHDLCTYPILDQIVQSPVTALKIEGRMKSPAYVATVVRIYRKALDRIRDGSWEPDPSDMRDLLLAFNRGFTTGHLGGAGRREVVGSACQDNRGLPIGTVVSCDTATQVVRVRLSDEYRPSTGDGLHFFLRGSGGIDDGWDLTTPCDVQDGILTLPCNQPVPPGSEVSITRSGALERQVRRILGSHHPAGVRRIPVEVEVTWEEGRPLFQGIIRTHEGGTVPVVYQAPLTMLPAVKHPVSPQEIADHVCRTGGTPFVIARCHLRYPGGLFAVPGQLNQMRREFLAAAEAALVRAKLPSSAECTRAHQRFIDEFRSEPKHPRVHHIPSPPSLSLTTLVSDLPGLHAAAEAGCQRVAIEAEPDVMAGYLHDIGDLMLTHPLALVWKWPRITGDTTISAALQLLPQVKLHGINEIMVDTIGAAWALHRHAPAFSRSGYLGLNVWNHHTVAAVAPLFSSLTLSPELSLTQLRALIQGSGPSHPAYEVLVQGNLEVMVSENCCFTGRTGCGRSPCPPFPHGARWGLRDQRDRFFPLEVDPTCRIHLFNAVETCTIDYLNEFQETGIDRIVIDARFRSPLYIRDLVALYRGELDRLSNPAREARTGMHEVKEEIKKRARGGITHGPLLKGLREPTGGVPR